MSKKSESNKSNTSNESAISRYRENTSTSKPIRVKDSAVLVRLEEDLKKK